MEWYLTCRQIAHAGDTLNAYCQLILAEILTSDPSSWPVVKKGLRSKDEAAAVARLKIQGENDSVVREALRERIGATWSPESEIIVELRNKIVHQGGLDPEGKIREVVRKFPPGTFFLYPSDLAASSLPFSIDQSDRIVVDAATGHWATRHVEHHIHLLDQNLCHRFRLPRKRYLPRKSSYSCGPISNGLPNPPGTPLPSTPPPAEIPSSIPALSKFPDYPPMATPEERECVSTWHRVRGEIDDFVRQCAVESSVDIFKFRVGVPGRHGGVPLLDHDHHLSYEMRILGDSDSATNSLGVRLRQEDNTPFITIWGSHTKMQDFRPCELSTEVKQYLQRCIEDTLIR